MTIQSKLSKLIATKADLKSAIESKGQMLDNVPFADYPNKVRDITSAGPEPEITNGILFNELDASGNLVKASIVGDNMSNVNFSGNTTLTDVTLDERITSIINNAFQASSVININMPSGLTNIGNYAFAGLIPLQLTSLPEGIKTIGMYAFENCQQISLTKLPNNLEKIGNYSFSKCYQLAITSTPSGLTEIPENAFQLCIRLTNIKMDNVAILRVNAFIQCLELASVSIGSVGNPVTSIDRYAFRSCSKLTKIDVYVEDPSVGITSGGAAPWGATNAIVNYLQA